MPHITDIPVDTILDNLLPCIAVPDLCHLACTSRFFATLLSDELFWERKFKDDFTFASAGTTRRTKWKILYRGFWNPKVYVWGCHDKLHGTLGLKKCLRPDGHRRTKLRVRDMAVPFPTEVHIPGVRIVNLIAGDMSFHALGSEGEVYVWGTLNGGNTRALRSHGYSKDDKPAYTPLKLALPTPTRTISCGIWLASSLDANNDVWMFLNWGRPFRLVSHLVDNSSEDSTPVQVICGWGWSAVLTKSGNALAWLLDRRTFSFIRDRNYQMDREGDKDAHATEDGIVPCVTWDLEIDPSQMPDIPQLPKLHDSDEETRLVQIAGLGPDLVGLTNHGHVLKIMVLDDNRASYTEPGTWQYLPKFSEVERVREHPVFSSATEPPHLPLEPPTDIHVTHITANFLSTFVAYSTGKSSIVLMGDTETDAESMPIIIPALQYRSVISVVTGEDHNAAITSDGTLLTWGDYSNGALGLGDPIRLKPGTPGGYEVEDTWGIIPPVSVPTEVRISNSRKKAKDMFCFAVAAAGRHTGALVIDLNPEAKDDDEREEDDLYDEDNVEAV